MRRPAGHGNHEGGGAIMRRTNENEAEGGDADSAELLSALLIGRDRATLRTCPENERTRTVREVFACFFSALFVGVGTAAGLSVADLPLALAVGAGLLFGFGILLFDLSYASMQIDRCAHDLAFGHDGLQRRLSRALGALPRLALALASAFFISTLMLQLVFGADAEGHRLEREAALNEAVRAKYERLADEQRERLMNDLTAATSSSSAVVARRAALEADIVRLEGEVSDGRRRALCERYGESAGRQCPEGVSGVPGEGPRHDFAQERVAQLERTLAKVRAARAALPAVPDTGAARASLEGWTGGHADEITRLVRADPAYRPLPDTILYRIESLWRLTREHPVLLSVVLALDVLLIAFDTMGMQIVGWAGRSPQRYAYAKADELLELDVALNHRRMLARAAELEIADEIDRREEQIRVRRFVRQRWRAADDEPGGTDGNAPPPQY